jgi:hypothetical protein
MDTGATGKNFINIKITQRICEAEQIELLRFLRSKIIQKYDRKESRAKIMHAIYPRFQIQDYAENTCFFLITKLHRPLIIGKAWIKWYGVVIDITNDLIYFKPNHCSHVGAGYGKSILVTKATFIRTTVTESEKIAPLQSLRVTKILQRPAITKKPPELSTARLPKEEKLSTTCTITMIGAVPFRQLIKRKKLKYSPWP